MAFDYYAWRERLEDALDAAGYVEACSAAGAVDAEVSDACAHPDIRAVLNELDANGGEGNEVLARELAEYGAWTGDDLLDQDANEERIVWITACEMEGNEVLARELAAKCEEFTPADGPMTYFVLEVVTTDGSRDTFASTSLARAAELAQIDESCASGRWWTVTATDAGAARLMPPPDARPNATERDDAGFSVGTSGE